VEHDTTTASQQQVSSCTSLTTIKFNLKTIIDRGNPLGIPPEALVI